MVDARHLVASDQRARSDALDVSRSFIVQAPAGSGKTELLIQRYLKLLAIVNSPEEVVAITFTRKAAAEMRLRAFVSLQNAKGNSAPDEAHERITFNAARAVLDRDRDLGWNLTEFPHRMRIQTMDGLNTGIARSLPLSSALGGVPTTLADAQMTEIYRAAAEATLDWLASSDARGSAVERVFKHLDSNTANYVDHVARMLQKRDQWLTIVGSSVSSTEEIGFVRESLEQHLRAIVTKGLEGARMLIPDDLADRLASLAAYAAQNLGKNRPEHPAVELDGLVELPTANANSLASWRGITELLLTQKGTWRKRVNKNDGFPPKNADAIKDFLELLDMLRDLDGLCECLHRVRQLPPPRYEDGQWEVLLALFKVLPLAVAELSSLFADRGVVDHIEVALAANRALGRAGDPGEIALMLDHQINHLLVDEMQDTSISQYRMLEKLVEGWQPGDGRTLFCVGDPMQSIYRFRDAEVGQFLVARDRGIGQVKLESLLLRQNFRSGEQLVHWFNDTFRQILPPGDDVSVGAISYADAVVADEDRGKGTTEIHPVIGGNPFSEAEVGVGVVKECLKSADQETIAILVRSRTQLPILLAGLRKANVEYHAVEIDRLTDLPEVIDILALTRALCHLGDRIAWLGVLRGPWVGLTWADLHSIVAGDSHSVVWDLLQRQDLVSRLSDGSQWRVTEFVRTITPFLNANAVQSLRDRVEAAWFALGGPAVLTNREAVEHVYRFLDVVGKYETAGTLADIARLESLLDEERVSNRSSHDCRLQVSTIHKAKGLEFDHVILYGLGRTPRGSKKSVLNWLTMPGEDEAGSMIISPVGARSAIENDPLHRYIEVSEQEKERYERDRLLYVACTRAKQSLHLIGHAELAADGLRTPRADCLLHRLWPAVREVYEKRFQAEQIPVGGEVDDMLVEPTLRRFAEHLKLPEAPQLPGLSQSPDGSDGPEEAEIDYYWVGSSARHAGTIVHRWLQQAGDGTVTIDEGKLSELRPVNERWSEKLGVPSEEVGPVCDRVEEALHGILTDPKGRWSLFGDGHAELPVTGVWNGRVESVVIDRVRIDEQGVHWIVDYKTSTHEGGDLEGFLEQESERYRPQLEKYAALYRALGDSEVRVALYFPMLQEFREVSFE